MIRNAFFLAPALRAVAVALLGSPVHAASAPSASLSPDGSSIAGPVYAAVVDVIDGDTIKVRANVWVGVTVAAAVRLEAVDAPEITNAGCPEERALGEREKRYVAAFLARGSAVLKDVEQGKYAGRVVARIEAPSGEDLGAALMDAGLTKPYGGGRNGEDGWCARLARAAG